MQKSRGFLKAPIFSFVALLAGTIAPLVAGAVSNIPLINPIWGSLFGLGFWTWNLVLGIPPFGNAGAAYVLFGALIWPLAIATAVAFGIDRLNTLKSKYKPAIWIVLIISLLTVAPERAFNGWPIYLHYFG